MRLLILIGGHLATAPRPQKEAAAAVRAGFMVTVGGHWRDDALAEEDVRLAAGLGVAFTPITDVRKKNGAVRWLQVKQRAARELSARCGLETVRALGWAGPEMLAEALKVKAELTMVHSEAGLWVAEQLRRKGMRVGVDFEDWFSEDLPVSERRGRPLRRLRDLERGMLHQADLTLTTTAAMARGLAEAYECDRVPEVMPNCFTSCVVQDPNKGDDRNAEALSLYWFSQTVGPGRGLENLARALSGVVGEWELHLRGNVGHYADWLKETFSAVWERVRLHEAVANEDLPQVTASHDVGLALEEPYAANKDLTASNKIFEYLRCGLAVVATETRGQNEVMGRALGAGWRVPPGEESALREVLQACVNDRGAVEQAKQRARHAAVTAWAWESYEARLGELLVHAAT